MREKKREARKVVSRSVYVDADVWEKLGEIARADRRTRNFLIREILAEWVRRHYLSKTPEPPKTV